MIFLSTEVRMFYSQSTICRSSTHHITSLFITRALTKIRPSKEFSEMCPVSPVFPKDYARHLFNRERVVVATPFPLRSLSADAGK